MTIYLACTVRGDRSGLAAARELCRVLEARQHTVLTTHLLADDVDEAEAALGDKEVFDRDLRWLESADLLIAEASGSSYGVGFEVGYVLGRAGQSGQRVLLFYDAARRGRVSRLLAGTRHPACTVFAYENPSEMAGVVDRYLEGPTPRTGCGEAYPPAAELRVP